MAVSPEAWAFRQARLELSRRRRAGNDMQVATELLRQSFATKGSTSAEYVRSLMGMHSVGATHQDFLTNQLDHPDEHVRAWAIRLLTENLPIDDALGPVNTTPERRLEIEQESAKQLPELVNVAKHDTSALVRLALASTLQRLPVSMRAALATPLAAHFEDADDHNIPLMLWYGLMATGDRHPEDLVEVAKACRIPTTLRLISRSLAEKVHENPDALNALVALAAKTDDRNFKSAVVNGIHEGWAGWHRRTPTGIMELARSVQTFG